MAHGSQAPRRISVVQRIAIWERTPFDASPAVTAAERSFWTWPSATLPTDGIVRDTARRIVGDVRQPKAQARAIYDWVVANTWRDAKVAGCGTGDIAGMLREQRLGGKCVDINSLMVGLCRAVGLPERSSAAFPRQRVQLPSPVIVRSIARLLPTIAGTTPFAGEMTRASTSKRSRSGSASSLSVSRSPPLLIAAASSTSARPERMSTSPRRLPLRGVPVTCGPISRRTG